MDSLLFGTASLPRRLFAGLPWPSFLPLSPQRTREYLDIVLGSLGRFLGGSGWNRSAGSPRFLLFSSEQGPLEGSSFPYDGPLDGLPVQSPRPACCSVDCFSPPYGGGHGFLPVPSGSQEDRFFRYITPLSKLLQPALGAWPLPSGIFLCEYPPSPPSALRPGTRSQKLNLSRRFQIGYPTLVCDRATFPFPGRVAFNDGSGPLSGCPMTLRQKTFGRQALFLR